MLFTEDVPYLLGKLLKSNSAPASNEEWVQIINQELSPKFWEFAMTFGFTTIEPLIQKIFKQNNLPNIHLKFTKLELGDIAPKIANLKIHDMLKKPYDQTNSVIIDFDLKYLGNCDLQISILGLGSGGVSDLGLSGRIRLVLKPKIDQFPFFGGLQFCFLDVPAISFDLDGIADIIDWPPIKRLVLKDLQEGIATLCVYPNFSKITLSPDWKITEVALGFKPTAVVVVKLVSAKDLAKKSGLSGIISSIVGQNLPDPYATITFGASFFKTDVVKNTQNPIWSEIEFVFLLDTPSGHKIKVDFYDEDALSRDGYLGYISKDIGSIPQGEVLNETLELLLNDEIDNDSGTPKKGKGKATFEFQILPLKQENYGKYVIVNIFLYSFNNIVSSKGTYSSTQATVQTGDQIKLSKIIGKTPHPSFNESFVFLMDSQIDEIIINLKDVETGSEIGKIILPKLILEDIDQTPIKGKIFPIIGENSNMTATLSMNIKYC